MTDDSPDLLKGTLDLLVLRALSFGPRHGYAVARWVEDATNGALLLEEGALYHALHRLEKRGSAIGTWGLSDNNRRARYYSLTPSGRQALATRTRSWTRYVEAMSAALRYAGHVA